jgi:hypothetical protein
MIIAASPTLTGGAPISQPESTFFDDLASAYLLIFEDWNATIEGQGAVLSRLLPLPGSVGMVLNCACGIGPKHSYWPVLGVSLK